MRNFFLHILDSLPYLKCLAFVINNYLFYFKGLFFIPNNSSGNVIHSPDESVFYAKRVVDDYKNFSGTTCFSGHCLEIGPGQSFLPSCLFLTDGADSVTLVDRFPKDLNKQDLYRLYTILVKDKLSLETFTNKIFNKLQYNHLPIDTFCLTTNSKFNYIFSTSVFEHLPNPSESLCLLHNVMASNSKMIHKVDLRDHGMFTPFQHENFFLTIPDFLYSKMVSHIGYPNRFMLPDYIDTLNLIEDIEYEIFVTRLVGVGSLNPPYRLDNIPDEILKRSLIYLDAISSKLSSRFSMMPRELLAVSGFFMVVNKF